MAMVGSGCVRNPSPGDQRFGISLVSQWLRSRFEAPAAGRRAVKFRRVGARVKRRDPRPTLNLAPPKAIAALNGAIRFGNFRRLNPARTEPHHRHEQRRIDCRQAEMLGPIGSPIQVKETWRGRPPLISHGARRDWRPDPGQTAPMYLTKHRLSANRKNSDSVTAAVTLPPRRPITRKSTPRPRAAIDSTVRILAVFCSGAIAPHSS